MTFHFTITQRSFMLNPPLKKNLRGVNLPTPKSLDYIIPVKGNILGNKSILAVFLFHSRSSKTKKKHFEIVILRLALFNKVLATKTDSLGRSGLNLNIFYFA